ncbi:MULTISPECIES: DDE-type integrase/transposase/recombinase [unclassified Methylobacterium]|jgi:putative transposase|uniref:DDE-type integrase/transposase/recombinase n=1 Tax=unclassified Methylobacterium TaxID=2615210 RepID=UPI0005BCD3B2|nr:MULTISPECIES: DDE-type integrase/transposase/recombinase [unclassified Methylobacterium]SFU96730.1 putative transposase [Methylobacterium sp. UNCCL125]
MTVPFINFPLGSSVRIEDVTHTFMSREQAGYVFRSEVDGRTVTHGSGEIASLYFADKFVIPRQVHPSLPAGVRENLRRSLVEFPDHRQAEAERRLDYVMAIDGLEDRRRGGDRTLFRRNEQRYASVARAVASMRRRKATTGAALLDPAARRELKAEATPSAFTLRDWMRRWERSGREPSALVRLDDRKGRKPNELAPALVDLLTDAVRTFYLKEERPTVRMLHEYVAGLVQRHNRETGDRLTPLTETALHRFVTGRFGARELAEARLGKRKGTMRFAAKRRRGSPNRACEVIEIDHVLLDATVIRDRGGEPLETDEGAPRCKRGIAGRPWLTLAICARTRCVVGWSISLDPPSYVSVMLCLRSMLSAKPDVTVNGRVVANPVFGLPKVLRLDNGKEFHSLALKAAAAKLGFELLYCPRRSPWEKGRVERFFGEVQRNFATMPGRTFGSPERRGDYRPHDRARMTMGELRATFAIWVAAYYHQRNHRGLFHRTPMEVWLELSPLGVDMPPSARDAVSATALPLLKPIQDTGIEYLDLHWDSEALERLRDRHGRKRKWRCALDPLDLTELRVWDDTVEPNVEIRVPCTDLDLIPGLDLDMWKRVKNRSKERTPEAERVRRETLADARVELFETAARDDRSGKRLSKPKQKFAAGARQARDPEAPPRPEETRGAAPLAALSGAVAAGAVAPVGSVATRTQYYD